MRMKGKDEFRGHYVTARGRRVVVVRVFVKKTQKTPRREIDLALGKGQGVTNDEPHARLTIYREVDEGPKVSARIQGA